VIVVLIGSLWQRINRLRSHFLWKQIFGSRQHGRGHRAHDTKLNREVAVNDDDPRR